MSVQRQRNKNALFTRDRILQLNTCALFEGEKQQRVEIVAIMEVKNVQIVRANTWLTPLAILIISRQ